MVLGQVLIQGSELLLGREVQLIELSVLPLHLHGGVPGGLDVIIAVQQVLLGLLEVEVGEAHPERHEGTDQPSDVVLLDQERVHHQNVRQSVQRTKDWKVESVKRVLLEGHSDHFVSSTQGAVGVFHFLPGQFSKLLCRLEQLNLMISMSKLNWISEASEGIDIESLDSFPEVSEVDLILVMRSPDSFVPLEQVRILVGNWRFAIYENGWSSCTHFYFINFYQLFILKYQIQDCGDLQVQS